MIFDVGIQYFFSNQFKNGFTSKWIYVNSINHNYDPVDFLQALPGDRIAYGHIAGHYNEAEDLLVDTHGADTIDSVWSLLEQAYDHFGVFPTLLERDFNIPSVTDLISEVDQISAIQEKFATSAEVRVWINASEFQRGTKSLYRPYARSFSKLWASGYRR